MRDFLNVFDVYFVNVDSYKDGSCTWNLRKIWNGDVMFNEQDNCWDIVTYNRFFYDDDTCLSSTAQAGEYQYDINDEL